MSTELKQLEKSIKLNEEDYSKIATIKNSINVTDSGNVLQYGVSTQTRISEFSDRALSEIKSKDTGHIGEVLTDLMLKVKGLEVDKLGSDNFMSKIPLLGSLMNSSKKWLAKFETVNSQIEKITDELVKSKMVLMRDITLFDQLYSKNLEYFKELNLFILAGEKKLEELNNEAIEMKSVAEASDDQAVVQKYNDFTQSINRFEKKLHDLKLSKTLALQMAPQIRLIQNGDQMLVEKIQSSILNTIPLWKNQIVIAVSLIRQQKALELQKSVTQTTNDMLKKNSEMLKTGTIEIVRESEKGIVEIETLKKINTDLIETITETLKIQDESRGKRRAAEVELVSIENELKQKLLR